MSVKKNGFHSFDEDGLPLNYYLLFVFLTLFSGFKKNRFLPTPLDFPNTLTPR